MATDEFFRSSERQFEPAEWEAQKENFYHCYIEENMTLSKAARYMKTHHNFDATTRQWERKIKQWGFTKYKSQEERLQQIAESGKTVYEVSQPGRRPPVQRGGRLLPIEDRNIRRFARRHLSRSPTRNRANSSTQASQAGQSDQDSDDLNTYEEQTYDCAVPTVENFHMKNGWQPDSITVPLNRARTNSPDTPQVHFMHPTGSNDQSNAPSIFISIPENQALSPGMSHARFNQNSEPFPDLVDDYITASSSSQGIAGPGPISYTYPGAFGNNVPALSQSFSSPGNFSHSTNQHSMSPEEASIMSNPFGPSQQSIQQSNDFGMIPVIQFENIDASMAEPAFNFEQPIYSSSIPMAGTSKAITQAGPSIGHMNGDIQAVLERYTNDVQLDTTNLLCSSSKPFDQSIQRVLQQNLFDHRKVSPIFFQPY